MTEHKPMISGVRHTWLFELEIGSGKHPHFAYLTGDPAEASDIVTFADQCQNAVIECSNGMRLRRCAGHTHPLTTSVILHQAA
jgi:hypothetical protein